MADVGGRLPHHVAYSDIFGNRCLQYFLMALDGRDNVLQSTVNNSINRIGIP